MSKRRIPTGITGVQDIAVVPGTNLLLALDGNTWVVYPLGSSKPSLRLAPASEAIASVHVAGQYLVRDESSGITIFNAQTLAKTSKYVTPSWRVSQAHLTGDGGTLVLATGKDIYPDQLVALDATTGVKKWARDMSGHFQEQPS